jgi:hypothetical protein
MRTGGGGGLRAPYGSREIDEARVKGIRVRVSFDQLKSQIPASTV